MEIEEGGFVDIHRKGQKYFPGDVVIPVEKGHKDFYELNKEYIINSITQCKTCGEEYIDIGINYDDKKHFPFFKCESCGRVIYTFLKVMVNSNKFKTPLELRKYKIEKIKSNKNLTSRLIYKFKKRIWDIK